MEWEKVQLGDVLDYEQPTKYIVSSSDYSSDKTKTPVLTAGKTFVLGYTNETSGIFSNENLPVIIFDDFTTATKLVDFPFKVKSSAMKILHVNKKRADIRYIFYAIQAISFSVRKHKRHWISEYSKIEVPLPSLVEQKRIADKLDKVFVKTEIGIKQVSYTKSKSETLFSSYIRSQFDMPELEKVELEKVCAVSGGFGFPHSHQGNKKEKYPFYKVSDMNTEGNEVYMTKHNHSISDEVTKKLKVKIYPAGTIIFPKIGGAIATNKKRILSVPSTVDNNVMVLVPKEGMNSEYLYNYLLNFDLNDWSNKSSLPSIRKTAVEATKIPVPMKNNKLDFIMQEQFAKKMKTVQDKTIQIAQLADKNLLAFSKFKQSTMMSVFQLTT